jgi:hypothetical protein
MSSIILLLNIFIQNFIILCLHFKMIDILFPFLKNFFFKSLIKPSLK